MGGGDLWKAFAWAGTVAIVAVLTTAIWLIADGEAIEAFFGDCPHLPEGVAALPAETGGEGHERGSAAEKSEIAPHETAL